MDVSYPAGPSWSEEKVMHVPLISLAAVLATKLECVQSSVEHNVDYWIELELQAVYWKPACLTTGGCANPRFRISKSSKFSSEIISVSWSITENFVEKHSRKFVSHWVRGHPQEVMLQCEVIGMDPLYGFPRTCDTSQNIEIFRIKDKEEKDYPEARAEDELSISERRGKLIVEVRAKCFNASFAVQKYTDRCPWCPEEDAMALIESATAIEPMENSGAASGASVQEFSRIVAGEEALLVFLVSLSLMSLIGLACLLVVVSKQRHSIAVLQKRSPLLKPGTRLGSYMYSEQLAKPAKNSDERYDIPWDQKCILKPCWHAGNPSNDRNCSVISSRTLNRSSAPVLIPPTYMPRRTTITGTLSTTSKHLSPNSSLGEHHEDSGLESV